MCAPNTRLFWLKILVSAALLSELSLSPRLWVSSRLFPLAPLFPSLPTIPFPVDIAAFVTFLGLLAAIIVFPRPRRLIIAASAIAAALAFFDQMRWQPWFYQYAFMLAALGSCSWSNGDSEGSETAVNSCRLIVASIYFYSGLQKLKPGNVSFSTSYLLGPIARLLPIWLGRFFLTHSVIAPVLEIGIGVTLLSEYRACAIPLALFMHGIILFSIGPLGYNVNSIIWPWNITMPLCVIILCWRTDRRSFRELAWGRNGQFHKLIFILFAIMPAFSFCNLWDSYLSWTLYSGNINNAQIIISEDVRNRLPSAVRRYTEFVGTAPNKYFLDIGSWSAAELNVPVYPETRVYKAIARNICGYANVPTEVGLNVWGKPTALNAGRNTIYTCATLDKW